MPTCSTSLLVNTTATTKLRCAMAATKNAVDAACITAPNVTHAMKAGLAAGGGRSAINTIATSAAISADLIATVEGFSREECDQLAVDSQDRCAKALAEGRFDKSLVPILDDDGSVREWVGAVTDIESSLDVDQMFEREWLRQAQAAAGLAFWQDV